MSQQVAIFDLDGCLSNDKHRKSFVIGKKKDYKSYFDLLGEDPVNQPVLEVYLGLMHQDITPIIFTGRGEEYRKQTYDWLAKNNIPNPIHAWMRPKGDFRNGPELKLQFLEQLRENGVEITMAFDDRLGIIQMYRQEGIMAFHCSNDT